MHIRTAYLPLATYPDAVADQSILAAVRFASVLDCTLHVTTFSVNIPQVSSPFGDLLLDVPSLVRSAEQKSKADCRRYQDMVKEAAGKNLKLEAVTKEIVLGAAHETAAYEARYYDLTLLPWAPKTVASEDLAQTVVFGSGRPVILIPPDVKAKPLEHIAVAWDGSTVAARALWDALPLLRKGGHVSVLTIGDEKALRGPDLARTLATHLENRGIKAQAYNIKLEGRRISDALQETAIEKGANLLVMGGFGHSRFRDFLLGGATSGILTKLQMPVLLSH